MHKTRHSESSPILRMVTLLVGFIKDYPNLTSPILCSTLHKKSFFYYVYFAPLTLVTCIQYPHHTIEEKAKDGLASHSVLAARFTCNLFPLRSTVRRGSRERMHRAVERIYFRFQPCL